MKNIKLASVVREEILDKIKNAFATVAIEGHLQGSMARGNTDQYSDIDIWLTFSDEDFLSVQNKRLDYYAKVGEIVHICEAPQNRPSKGIFSSVIYSTDIGFLVVDYVLCPLSTSYKTEDYRYLFGDIDLPSGVFSYNEEKVLLPETYRLDFFISIIVGSIKKLRRGRVDALDFLVEQYSKLRNVYSISVPDLGDAENTFKTLKDIIEKVKKVATPKQRIVLSKIENFLILD